MNFIQRVSGAFMAAARAYFKTYYMTDQEHVQTFESYDARLSRYEVNQSYYDNTVFQNLHGFAQSIKATQPVLYDYIQAIYNPAYRLAEVYRMNIWGGLLDQDAGAIGAMPFVVGKTAKEKETELREAIAQTLQNSNWAVNKTILPAMGARLGDCVLVGVDDKEHERVYMQIVHPSEIEDADMDGRGYVKSYKRSYMRLDGEEKTASKYTETAERGEGEEVIYKTYKNDKPWMWDGNPAAEWVVNWGFIPLVLFQHSNDGLKWGLAEFHTLIPKINGVEDMASILHDAARKAAENPGLLSGVTKPDPTKAKFTQTAKTSDEPEPGREERKFVYGPAGAQFTSMVFPLDIASISAEIQNSMRDWERDYPELIADVWGADARVDGVLTAKGKVEKKIIERRSAYDGGVVAMLKMLIAIAGDAGYPGYESFDLTSYDKGLLDFTIAPRPVFPKPEAQVLAENTAFWQGYAPYIGSAVTFEMYARSLGKSDEWIAEIMRQMSAEELAQKVSGAL